MSAFLRRLAAKRMLCLLNRSEKFKPDKNTIKQIQEALSLRPVKNRSQVGKGSVWQQLKVKAIDADEGIQPGLNTCKEVVSRILKQERNEIDPLRLEPEVVAKEVIDFITCYGNNYGYTDADGNLTKQGTIVVEFSSPNIAKPFHAGHLRSTLIGNYIANLYTKLGYNVVRLNYLGDWGTQFGLLAVGFQQYGDMAMLKKAPMQHLFEVYVKIHEQVEEEKSRNEETTMAAGLEAFRKMEEGDESLLPLWRKFRELSIQEYSKTYARLGIYFTKYHSESMYHSKSLELIDKLKDSGILQFDDKGRGYVEVDTAQEHNKNAVMLKSDGTTLYLTRDVAALLDRYEKYNFDKIHYVVEDGQNLHFRHLVGVVKRIAGWANRLTDDVHIRFGRVAGMSTRKGKVVFLKDILDEGQFRMKYSMIKHETTKVEKEQMDTYAEIVAMNAIILQDLSRPSMKDYKFDWNSITNSRKLMLQYTHARLCNLIDRQEVQLEDTFDPSYLTGDAAQQLLLHLARYEDVVQNPSTMLEPFYTAQYLFELCSYVDNVYFHDEFHLSNLELQPDRMQAIIQLFNVSLITLANGMRLLGMIPLRKV